LLPWLKCAGQRAAGLPRDVTELVEAFPVALR